MASNVLATTTASSKATTVAAVIAGAAELNSDLDQITALEGTALVTSMMITQSSATSVEGGTKSTSAAASEVTAMGEAGSSNSWSCPVVVLPAVWLVLVVVAC